MPDTKYLTQRSGLWLFRRRVPDDCRQIFNDNTFVVKSLETHNIREARAKRNQMVAEMDMLILKHRSTPDSESDTEYYKSMLALYISADHDALSEEYSQVMGKLEAVIGSKDIKPNLAHLVDQLPTMSESARSKVLADEHAKAQLEEIPDSDERVRAKALQNAYLGIQHDLAHTSLKDALKQHLDDNGHQLKANTHIQVKNSVSRFLSTIDKVDIPLKDIGRKMVKNFINVQQAHRSGSTVKNYVTFMSSIWKHAADLEDISGSNPFAGHKIEKDATQSFQLFEDDELATIFKETEKYKGHKDNFKYIIPRLGYVTGCRIEELCSLTCEQIVEDAETGISYIQVDEGKTKNAVRKIPIHDWVKDAVLAQKKAVGSGILFPLLETQRNDGKRGDKVSKWFGRLKKDVVTRDVKTGFHSFRVHVATNFERAEVAESTAVWILGHTRNLSLSYGLYSKGPTLGKLKEVIELLPVADGWG